MKFTNQIANVQSGVSCSLLARLPHLLGLNYLYPSTQFTSNLRRPNHEEKNRI